MGAVGGRVCRCGRPQRQQDTALAQMSRVCMQRCASRLTNQVPLHLDTASQSNARTPRRPRFPPLKAKVTKEFRMGAATFCHTASGSCVTSLTCAQLSTLPGLAAAAAAWPGAAAPCAPPCWSSSSHPSSLSSLCRAACPAAGRSQRPPHLREQGRVAQSRD